MPNIKFRSGLGRPLTHEELDNNFRYLNTWEPDTAFFRNQYVLYENGGSNDLYIAKFDIPPLPFFNPQDWTKLGDSNGGISGTIISDMFIFEIGTVESPFILSQSLDQLISVEINGDDRVESDDFFYDNINNQVLFTSSLFNLQNDDVIIVKYTTSDSTIGSNQTNENLKNIRTITPNNNDTFQILDTDEYISILSDNLTTGFTLNLPINPIIGHEIKIIDASGNVNTNGLIYNISTISPYNIENLNNINLPNLNYGFITLIYLGSNLWKII